MKIKINAIKPNSKLELVLFLKNLLHLSLADAKELTNVRPFITDDVYCLAETDKITLAKLCEYELILSDFEIQINEEQKCVNEHREYIEQKYLEAKNWYNLLSKEDQEKVDLLMSSCIPRS